MQKRVTSNRKYLGISIVTMKDAMLMVVSNLIIAKYLGGSMNSSRNSREIWYALILLSLESMICTCDRFSVFCESSCIKISCSLKSVTFSIISNLLKRYCWPIRERVRSTNGNLDRSQ